MDENTKLTLNQILSAKGDLTYIFNPADQTIEWFGSLQSGEEESLKDLITADTLKGDLMDPKLRDKEHVLSTSDGEILANETITRILTSDGKVEKIIGAVRLVEEGREHFKTRHERDSLTGLYNDNGLRHALQNALEKQSRASYALFSIDTIALLNSVYGSQHLQKILLQVAEILTESAPETSLLARLNTDHFALLFETSHEQNVQKVLAKSLKSLEGSEFYVGTDVVRLTASAGVVSDISPLHNAQDVMIRAQSALYEAKKAGGNCYRFASEDEKKIQSGRETMTQADLVRQALEEKRFTLAFQPVIETNSLKIAFYECLSRIELPGGEVLPAGKFMPAAEKMGLTRQIDQLNLKRAVSILKEQPEMQLSINISAFNAADGAFLQKLLHEVYENEDLASRLILEITETAAIADEEETRKFITIVRSLGCRIALDDFGEGNTSFRQLKNLPLDIVKVDGSFVKDLHTNASNQLFIKTLLELSDTHQFKIVAEAVETKNDLVTLKNMGVDYVQGYLFGKPDIMDSKNLDGHYTHKISNALKSSL